MKNFFLIFLSIFIILFVVGISGSFYYLYQRVEKLSLDEKKLDSESTQEVVAQNMSDYGECGNLCKEEIARVVSNAVATLSGTKVVLTTAPLPPSPNTSFISLGTTYTTTSTDWVNVDDTKVFIDLENDYGKKAKVSWEASLKVAHGNGKAFARLYDDTNKIAVDFSEVSTENNSTFKQVSTGNLPFWRGRNLYLVQVKSLNSFEVTYSGGRIKVSY